MRFRPGPDVSAVLTGRGGTCRPALSAVCFAGVADERGHLGAEPAGVLGIQVNLVFRRAEAELQNLLCGTAVDVVFERDGCPGRQLDLRDCDGPARPVPGRCLVAAGAGRADDNAKHDEWQPSDRLTWQGAGGYNEQPGRDEHGDLPDQQLGLFVARIREALRSIEPAYGLWRETGSLAHAPQTAACHSVSGMRSPRFAVRAFIGRHAAIWLVHRGLAVNDIAKVTVR
jgi:hypothetical protein